MDIGTHIKELREAKGLIQKELASKIGVSVQAVSAWEIGLRNPNATQRQKLCDLFDISESELFGGISHQEKISPEVLEALQDPIAVKSLLITSKSPHETKIAIKAMLDYLPQLSPEKRQALLALCK